METKTQDTLSGVFWPVSVCLIFCFFRCGVYIHNAGMYLIGWNHFYVAPFLYALRAARDVLESVCCQMPDKTRHTPDEKLTESMDSGGRCMAVKPPFHVSYN